MATSKDTTQSIPKVAANGVKPPLDRAALETRLNAGDVVSADDLKAALRNGAANGQVKQRCAEKLLDYALANRDAEAAQIVARAMDADPALANALNPLLNQALETQPDGVYAFARARLGVDDLAPTWIDWLRSATLSSLQVAICDGDTATIISWLKLIAREPAGYSLGDLLHHAMLAAQERARTEPELARALISLAAKRDPAALETLLDDPALLDAIPNMLGTALRDGVGDTQAIYETYGAEVFALVLGRGVKAHHAGLFTTDSIDHLWALFMAGGTPGYGADRVLEALTTVGTAWLPDVALETLLALALRDERDDLFLTWVRGVTIYPNFTALLANAIYRSGRSPTEAQSIMTQTSAVSELPPQATADTYAKLLALWEWQKSAQPLAAAFARLIGQHTALTTDPQALWGLLETAADTRDETTARLALRRLTALWESIEQETALADNLTRMAALIHWNPALEATALAWWRAYAVDAPPGRLVKLDKALENRRGLDEERAVVQTALAFHRLLGKRTIQQAAAELNAAFVTLQTLADAFEPSPRRALTIDSQTIRAELERHTDELPGHEAQILANTLKELAQTIASMGDNRSKPGLVRRGDDLDRQLMTGEHPLHGALDALKYMAGYLDGSQDRVEDEDE